MKRRSFCSLLTGITSAVPALAAAESVVRYGPLSLTFDQASGTLLQIACRDEIIAENPSGSALVSFAVGPAPDLVHWLEEMDLRRKLVSFNRPGPDRVEVTVQLGDFELVERYKLHEAVPRLDRSAALIYRGNEAVKLRGLTIRTAGVRAPGDGFYRFPQTWPPRLYPFSEMTPGRRRPGRGDTIAPLAAQIGPKRSLLWLSCTDDDPSVSVLEKDSQFDVIQTIQAQGYLKTGVPQEVGFTSMILVDGDYWAALPVAQQWLNSTGTKVPGDVPAWVRGATLYNFHPGGTIGSNWRDLGGFKAATERLMPSVERLGVSSIWILPVEFRSPYWPLDYYRFMDGLGTGDEFRELVARAHKMGLYVLQDLVPHGGAPSAVHNQQHPEFMLRREDGTTLTYWLNDFARPDWQDFIAKVTAHYMQNYGVDGYRVDAIIGSHESNWDPNIPYPRASMARLWGGLRMLERIRSTVKSIKPREGAVLAEVQSARHWPFSDLMFDFSFASQVCQGWRREPPAEYVAHMQDYLAEQNAIQPRGANWLRHLESGDSLRSQLWWGVEGMHAMYALSAWIDGIPVIYQGMESGHAFELKRINDIRRSRPELMAGEVNYRAVRCDKPGVFTCLRRQGSRQSVVAINFNYDPVEARLTWPGGQGTVKLEPLGYTLLPEPPAARPPAARNSSAAAGQARQIAGGMAFDDATEWLVDTAEGRLHDRFIPLRPIATSTDARGDTGIYWRPQNTPTIWQNDLPPLHPVHGCIGVKHGDQGWTIIRFKGPAPKNLRFVESFEGKTGLHLVGLEGPDPMVTQTAVPPAAPDFTKGVDVGPLSFRAVGPDYLIANRHFTVILRRQGGVMRELRAGDVTLIRDHDLFGDRTLRSRNNEVIRALHDVECGLTFVEAAGGMHLFFEGQLRGMDRFARKSPPIWYRNEYLFTDAARFAQKWAFRAERPLQNQAALLAWSVTLPESARPPIGQERLPVPERLALGRVGNTRVALERIEVPAGSGHSLSGDQLIISLLDSQQASLEEGKWHESRVDWVLQP
ncbi:MAG TPA: alpha-amylase family glycosyl hydrolase [Bryobacteraceae bacterium]|nr:alpha-amylase family glycosyl hydrolase [Bryobacteraceae bacterium]